MNFNFLIHEFWNVENSKNNNLDIETLNGQQLDGAPKLRRVDC